jgi:hypothetical protein
LVCANVSGLASGARSQDGDPRALVLTKLSASKRHFSNQAYRTPVDRQAIFVSFLQTAWVATASFAAADFVSEPRRDAVG